MLSQSGRCWSQSGRCLELSSRCFGHAIIGYSDTTNGGSRWKGWMIVGKVKRFTIFIPRKYFLVFFLPSPRIILWFETFIYNLTWIFESEARPDSTKCDGALWSMGSFKYSIPDRMTPTSKKLQYFSLQWLFKQIQIIRFKKEALVNANH